MRLIAFIVAGMLAITPAYAKQVSCEYFNRMVAQYGFELVKAYAKAWYGVSDKEMEDQRRRCLKKSSS
jgi:hypothetical protein